MLWKYVHIGSVYKNQVMDWCKGQEKKTQGASQHALKKLGEEKSLTLGNVSMMKIQTEPTISQVVWNAVEAELSIFPFLKSSSSSTL